MIDSNELKALLKEHLSIEVSNADNDPESDTMQLTVYYDGEKVAEVWLP